MINKVLIVGAGTMGKGISRLLNRSQIEHTLYGGHLFLETPHAISSEIESFDLIIECLPENIELKTQFLKNCRTLKFQGIIGTCTSSISILSLQEYAPISENFAGVHFMNPPTIIKAVELISSPVTSENCKNELKEWLQRLKSNVIEVGDAPGFLINSVLFVMLNQAAHQISSPGMTPEVIDNAMVQVCGHKLGPLATLDMIGIDVSLNILEELHRRDPKTHREPAEILYELNASGKLGRKTGNGFFTY